MWAGGVPDETAAMASLLLPAHYPLESWRDTAPRAGIRGLGQPVMQPVFESLPVGDILLAAAARSSSVKLPWSSTAAAVKAQWLALAPKADGTDPEDFWVTVRREGGLFEEQHLSALSLDPSAFKPPAPAAAQPELSVYAYPHIFLYDGRGADKPWLQELPEPVTQIVWDSWAEIHPETTRKLGVAKDDIIEVKTEHGAIGRGSGGAHCSSGCDRDSFGTGASRVRPLCKRRWRKCVDDFGAARDQRGRDRARDRQNSRARFTAGQQRHDGPIDRRSDEHRAVGARRGPQKRGRRSRRTVRDVPALEISQAQMGHDDRRQCLHRVQRLRDRVLRGEQCPDGRQGAGRSRPNHVVDSHRALLPGRKGRKGISASPPVVPRADAVSAVRSRAVRACLPVFASYHSEEGLNGQVYNRCVGTRYCENNCPYKVRRFNWFVPEWPAPLNLQLNPDVTVRGAGVMEKCTFCVQRIQFAGFDARTEDRELRDGEIVTACQQACPTRAITFGDSNDPASAMMRWRAYNKLRNYRALEELDTQPGYHLSARPLPRERRGLSGSGAEDTGRTQLPRHRPQRAAGDGTGWPDLLGVDRILLFHPGGDRRHRIVGSPESIRDWA